MNEKLDESYLASEEKLLNASLMKYLGTGLIQNQIKQQEVESDVLFVSRAIIPNVLAG
jgi:hypothetical protein